MNVLRLAALFVFLMIMVAFAQGFRSWELWVAAVLLAALVFWSCGGWFGTAEQDAECARIDAELDATERHPH